MRASSPKSGGILSQDNSIIMIQGNEKLGEMEDTMRAMQKRLNELQQEQGNNTIGARQLVNYMRRTIRI
jgi:hypothetical protein